MPIVARTQVAPPGARLPLVVLVVALAAGAVMFVRVHRGPAGHQHPRALVAGPAKPSPVAPVRATR